MRRNPTGAEKKLWYLLRDRRFVGVKFRRQVPIGRYIADFVCLRRKVIVEADGGQHCEASADATRDAWLTHEGYRVIRYSNLDILKILVACSLTSPRRSLRAQTQITTLT